jgi:hypothetical protein
MNNTISWPESQTCVRRARTQSLWQGHDSEENWNRNLADQRHRRMLEHSGWLSAAPIEYCYNSYGFRDQEFEVVPSGLALGCSFTEGVGVAESQSWPQQLQQILGVRVWNLGVGGAGIGTAFRMLNRWLTHLQPQFVVLLIPPAARLEICTVNQEFQTIMPTNVTDQGLGWHQDQYVRHWMAEPENQVLEQHKTLLAMQMLCQQQQVPFFSWDYSLLHNYGDYNQCRARDLAHFSPNAYNWFAQQAAAKIKTN